MDDPAELVTAAFILFFGFATLGLMVIGLRGGDVSAAADVVTDLAVPFVILLVLIFFVTTILQSTR